MVTQRKALSLARKTALATSMKMQAPSQEFIAPAEKDAVRQMRSPPKPALRKTQATTDLLCLRDVACCLGVSEHGPVLSFCAWGYARIMAGKTDSLSQF